ncbi:copper transport protein ATOX1-like [Apostichopus japonicus]|uniref:copper transport protein ATOX1-like n=1 Tax=Stichopus japonicus TaxID=307972 RepID=UPI003AB34FEA
MTKTYEFSVEMTCEGCSGAVDRILKRADGIASFDIDLPGKKVIVKTDLSSDQVLELLKKSGKSTAFVGES